MEIMIVILVIAAIYVLSGIKVVNQYQRGVVLTLGKFTGVREPGLRVVVPIFQTMMMVYVNYDEVVFFSGDSDFLALVRFIHSYSDRKSVCRERV